MLTGMSVPARDGPAKQAHVGRRLVWDISAISAYMARIADLLGNRIGVTGSQWLAIMAIDGLDQGDGVSVGDVASILNLDASFVSAQSKILEKKGIVLRTQSAADRRIVLLSLTEYAVPNLEELDRSKYTLEDHMCGGLEERSIEELSEALVTMRRRLGRAVLLVAAGE
jgi:DNA-binding MarR family transcriptional regulator